MIIGHMRARRAVVALAAAALAVTLSGCSDSVEDASADYCSNVATLQSELASLESLVTSDATLQDVEAQADSVRDAFDATTGTADDLDAAVATEAEDAYGSFQDAVDAIPSDATLSEAAELYADASRTYSASLAAIARDAGCSDSA